MSIEAFLCIKEYPAFRTPVCKSLFGTYRHLRPNGQPASKVRWHPWKLVLDSLCAADRAVLTHLAASHTATCTPYVEFTRPDGQGVHCTQWAQRALLCHWHQRFDARGAGPGASMVWTLRFAAERMGLVLGAWGMF